MIILPKLFHAQWVHLIVNHLWQSTIFVLAAWLLTLALKKNQARIRYWLWMLASMKFLFPFSLLIKAGERLHSHSSLATMPRLSAVMNGFTEPFSGSVAAQPVAPTAVSAAAQSVVQTHSDLLPMVLLAIWVCGALFLLARWGVRWLHIRRIVWTSSPIAVGCAVPVRSAPGHLEPGIFGIFRPVLLLPEGITERLSPAQLDAIVAHEICHVRRRDNLTAALHMLVEIVFWFYPLVWWIGAGLMEERELACDEAVVESHSEVLTYAEGILNVCKTYIEAPMTCVSGVMGSDLKKRISRILSGSVARKLNLHWKLLLALAAVLAVAAPVTTGVIHTAQVAAKVTVQQNAPESEEANAALEEARQRIEADPENLAAAREPLIEYMETHSSDSVPPEMYQTLGQFWATDERNANHLEEADRVYATASEIFPDNVRLLFNHAVILQKLGQAENAALLFEDCYDLSDNHSAHYLEEAATAYLNAGNMIEAMRAYARLIQDAETPEELWFGELIRICGKMGDQEEAKYYFRLAMDYYPNEESHWRSLASIYFDEGDFQTDSENPKEEGSPMLSESRTAVGTDLQDDAIPQSSGDNGDGAVYNLSEVDTPPWVLKSFRPPYPFVAKSNGIEGQVVLRFVVDAEGKAKNPEVVESEPEGVFEEPAMTAIERYEFIPSILNGEPVACIFEMPVDFKLD